MSFEVSLMNHIVSEVAKYLKDSDIEIVETHHNRKIDAPSGTAMTLAETINKTLNNEMHSNSIDMIKEKKEIQKKLVFTLLEVEM